MGIYKWDNRLNKEIYTPLRSLVDLSTIKNMDDKARVAPITTRRIANQGIRV